MHEALRIYHKSYVTLFSRNLVLLDLLNQIVPVTETTNVQDINGYECMKFIAG
jgi:hypothetical protein